MGEPGLQQIVEALLFSSDEPLTLSKLHALVPEHKPSEIRAAVESLREELGRSGRCFAVEEIAEGYQLLTRPEYGTWIVRLKRAKAEGKLSAAALETR